MAGVGIQQLFIFVFAAFAIQFHRVLLRGEGLSRQTQSKALMLLYTLYAVLALITVCYHYPPQHPYVKPTSHLIILIASFASSSACASTPKASTATSPTTRHISTVLTLCQCWLHRCFSISFIQPGSCRGKYRIFHHVRNGKGRG